MNADDLKTAVQAAREVAAEAAVDLQAQFGNIDYEQKDGNDDAANVVTQLDTATEKLIEQRLSKLPFDIGFYGEEFGRKGNKNRFWLVDPIDGTGHFVRGTPMCTTMIALVEGGRVMASVIHDFVEGDSFWAVRDGGAYKNEEKISVSTRNLKQSYLGYEGKLETPQQQANFLQARKRAIVMESVNCGKDFAWVASGKLDGRILDNPWAEDWDVAAGSLLIEEAGGRIANLGRQDYDYTNHDFLCANPIVFEELTSGAGAIFPIAQ